ncbi:MAG TPA: lysophospholipid acyltransferase family protein [Longimicrobium sp.]
MLRRLISLWSWASMLLVGLVWVPTMALLYVVTVPRDPGRYAVGWWFRRAAVTVVKLNPLWRFRTEGVRITDPRRPYVAVANHESIADIFLISLLPWEMKWLSKQAAFNIPLMGWMMRMAGDVGVARGSTRSRGRALEQCRDRLERRVSILIMPEGTRTLDGRLGPFQDGAFRLAVETKCPVLPIAVAGANHALAKGSWVMNPARAVARVLPPVETDGLTLADVPALRDRVRAMIDSARDELLHELGPQNGPVTFQAASGVAEPETLG